MSRKYDCKNRATWIPLVSRGGPRGGKSGYHCPCNAGHPKLDSSLEIPAQGQVGQFCCFLLPELAHSGQSARWPTLGVQRHKGSDSHFHLILGLPYIIYLAVAGINYQTLSHLSGLTLRQQPTRVERRNLRRVGINTAACVTPE